MSTSPAPLNELVSRIRGKYPGAYDDMDDATLTKAVLAKYPQYSDLAAPKIQGPAIPSALQPQAGGPAQGGAAIPQQIGASTNPKLNIALSGTDQPEYVGATGAAGAGLMAGSGATAAVFGGAKAALPYIVKAGQWAESNPELAKIALHTAIQVGGLGAIIKFLKK